MVTTKNKEGNHIRLYHSKYPYKNDSIDESLVIYKGPLSDCPQHLLIGIGVGKMLNTKYIVVWTKQF